MASSGRPLIIGVSGKKQSGKSSLCEYLRYWYALTISNKMNSIFQDTNGKITVSIHNDNDDGLATYSDDELMAQGVDLHGGLRVYNFADSLKELCMNVLGLTQEECYGTDEQKNGFTRYKWDNMPPHIRERYSNEKKHVECCIGDDEMGEAVSLLSDYVVPRSGFMTAREIMQVVGTDLFREMFSDMIWVEATLNRISKEKTGLAVIADCRFPSEVNAIIESGGYIIRLNRIHDSKDQHPSEIALDNFDFGALGERAIVLDNEDLSIEEKNQVAIQWLSRII